MPSEPIFIKSGFACRTVTILPYSLIVYTLTDIDSKVNLFFMICLYNLFFIYVFKPVFYHSHTLL